MKEELLIEHWGLPSAGDTPGNAILESVDTNGKLYITGVFMQAEIVNRNGRLYPKAVLEKAVNKYIQEQVLPKQALGELNHPPRANVDPLQACILIEELWWEGNNVMGKARIVEGDNGSGDKLAALIRAGWVPGVSSRGLGALKSSGKGYSVVQEGFKLTVGVDVVWGQSAPDARVKPMVESVEDKPLQPAESELDEAFKVLASRLEAL